MNSIDPKPAAGLFGGFLATLVVGLLNRYTSYQPSIEEASAIVGIFGFVCAWLVPDSLWGRVPPIYIEAREVEKPADEELI